MTAWLYIAFIFFVLAALSLDLAVVSRRGHVINFGEAMGWAGFWVALGMAFTGFIYYAYEHQWLGIGIASQLNGRQAAMQYVTGYLIEESLSVDNMVVFAFLFGYFHVPRIYQHRVLFWGILGAIVMRGIMIAAGTALLHQFAWVTYIFGALLLFSAIKLLTSHGQPVEPGDNPLVKLFKRFYPVTHEYHEAKFFVREGRRLVATPLFLVLLVVESTDLFFAIDSIPAVLAITRDPFLVFTSNIFAILGLRSVYFALSGLIQKFRYLEPSLIVLLGFVGTKMLLEHYVHISTSLSLSIILLILAVGVTASLLPWQKTKAYITCNFSGVAQTSLRQARRVVIFVIGVSVILVGVAMLFLPGPAMVVIPAGLAILATEFVWARRLLHRIKEQAMSVVNTVSGKQQDAKKDKE